MYKPVPAGSAGRVRASLGPVAWASNCFWHHYHHHRSGANLAVAATILFTIRLPIDTVRRRTKPRSSMAHTRRRISRPSGMNRSNMKGGETEMPSTNDLFLKILLGGKKATVTAPKTTLQVSIDRGQSNLISDPCPAFKMTTTTPPSSTEYCNSVPVLSSNDLCS